MHWAGHCDPQAPQPMQASHSTCATPSMDSAPNGHASTHAPQLVHSSASSRATNPDDAMIGLPYWVIASMPAQQHEQQLQIA